MASLIAATATACKPDCRSVTSQRMYALRLCTVARLLPSHQKCLTHESRAARRAHMQVEYLLCYAAAGTKVQFCALKRNDKERVYCLGQRLDIYKQAELLACFKRCMIISAIICAQRHQLSLTFQPLGAVVERSNG
eukprot:18955-Heterococcus_DN1.PRE.1